MKTQISPVSAKLKKELFTSVVVSAALCLLLFAPAVFAGNAGFGQTRTEVCGFFNNINNLLNLASIAVVTIAIIFAGYQIAFAHKRIGDVAPILIGGVLIGAAAQIAKMLLGDDSGDCAAAGGGGMALLSQVLPAYA